MQDVQRRPSTGYDMQTGAAVEVAGNSSLRVTLPARTAPRESVAQDLSEKPRGSANNEDEIWLRSGLTDAI